MLMVDDEIVAIRASVDCVREETRTGRTEGLENRLYLKLREIAGQHDAMLDVDVEVVGGHLQVRQRLPYDAAAVIPRRLRTQRLRTQRHCDRAGHRSGQHVERLDDPSVEVAN